MIVGQGYVRGACTHLEAGGVVGKGVVNMRQKRATKRRRAPLVQAQPRKLGAGLDRCGRRGDVGPPGRGPRGRCGQSAVRGTAVRAVHPPPVLGNVEVHVHPGLHRRVLRLPKLCRECADLDLRRWCLRRRARRPGLCRRHCRRSGRGGGVGQPQLHQIASLQGSPADRALEPRVVRLARLQLHLDAGAALHMHAHGHLWNCQGNTEWGQRPWPLSELPPRGRGHACVGRTTGRWTSHMQIGQGSLPPSASTCSPSKPDEWISEPSPSAWDAAPAACPAL